MLKKYDFILQTVFLTDTYLLYLVALHVHIFYTSVLFVGFVTTVFASPNLKQTFYCFQL